MDIRNKILTNSTERWVDIYSIMYKETGKQYIGQTVSHVLNHGKYRPYGWYVFINKVKVDYGGVHVPLNVSYEKCIKLILHIRERHKAKHLDAGNSLESYATTSDKKLLEGTRVMTVTNGNNA